MLGRCHVRVYGLWRDAGVARMSEENVQLWGVQIDHPSYTMHLTIRQRTIAGALSAVLEHLQDDDDALEYEAVAVTVRQINEH